MIAFPLLEEEKLSKLLRTDFYFGTPKEKMYLGKLLKVDYPQLYFVVDEERIDEVKENVSEGTIKAFMVPSETFSFTSSILSSSTTKYNWG